MMLSRSLTILAIAGLILTGAAGCKKSTSKGNFPTKETRISRPVAGTNADGTAPPEGTINSDGSVASGQGWGTDGSSAAGASASGAAADAAGTLSEGAGSSMGELGAPTPALPNVFFDLDSTELSTAAIVQLEKNAAYLVDNTNLFVVLRGHCDDSGTDEYNIALGTNRAQAVREFLAGQGVDAARLETISFGESIPAVEGEDEASRAQNRRVEFFIYTK
jgi:peptidoglycan-associated lipoprotein